MQYIVMLPSGRQNKAVEILSLQIVVFQAIRDGADATSPESFQHFLILTTKVAQTVAQMQRLHLYTQISFKGDSDF